MSIQIEEIPTNHEGTLDLNNSNQEKINISPQSAKNLSFNIVNKITNSNENGRSFGNHSSHGNYSD